MCRGDRVEITMMHARLSPVGSVQFGRTWVVCADTLVVVAAEPLIMNTVKERIRLPEIRLSVLGPRPPTLDTAASSSGVICPPCLPVL